MKLTNEQLKAVAFGAVETREEPEGLRFFKCTHKQINAWQALEPVLGDRARSTTGVRLDFHTDAKAIRFLLSDGNKTEVLIDGVFRAQYRMKTLREKGEVAELPLCDALSRPLSSCRVTLALPSHDDGGRIAFVELVDATYCRPHEHKCRMLMIGDSITQGWNSAHDTFSYAWRVTNHFDADSIIQGVGGGFYHESTFDEIGFDPDIVTVAYGTNDYGHYKTFNEAMTHARAFLSLIAKKYQGKKIFVITPIWRADRDKAMGDFGHLCDLYRELALSLSLIPVDGLLLEPPMPEFYADEFLHPHDLGFSLYAERLIVEMEKHL